MVCLLLFGLRLAMLMVHVEGHGRLIVPPARPSAWREGFGTPIDYTDNDKNCGGTVHQWTEQGGKCGICGDPYDMPQPRKYENGGEYGTGTIVREYIQAQVIPVKVDLTAPHMGWFEFRICKLEDTSKPATLECLDKNLLYSTDGEARHPVEPNVAMIFEYAMRLPRDLTCEHCVFQWKYHGGNSWGEDEFGSGIGHGSQEEFYACADIMIKPFSSVGGGATLHPAPPRPATTPRPTTTTNPNQPATTTRTNAHGPAGSSAQPGDTPPPVGPPSEGFQCKFQFPTDNSYINSRLDELCLCACNRNMGVCDSQVCFCY